MLRDTSKWSSKMEINIMKTKEDLKLSAVSEDKWRLIRLFRCMVTGTLV